MRYVMSIERIGMEKGILQTSREAVIDNLEVHFERGPPSLVEALQRIDDPSLLRSLRRQAITVGSLEEFEQVLGEVA